MAYHSEMAYIFVDESGDLGFDFKKKKTSRYFIVTFVFTTEKAPLERIVKKIFKSFSKAEIRSHNGTLHAHKEKPRTRQKLLHLFNEKKAATVITIYLNKKKVHLKLQNEKHVLYNYVTNILLDRVCTKDLVPKNEKICVIASRRETNKFLNENFSNYLRGQARNNHKLDIEVHIAPPSSEKSLQTADFISWAIFRKYEHGDESYYDIIKENIIEENALFP